MRLGLLTRYAAQAPEHPRGRFFDALLRHMRSPQTRSQPRADKSFPDYRIAFSGAFPAGVIGRNDISSKNNSPAIPPIAAV